MESENSGSKDEYIISKVSDRKLIGLLPMFILVLIIVLRISWTIYKSFVLKMDSHEYSSAKQETVGAIWFMMVAPPLFVSFLIMMCLLYSCYKTNMEMTKNAESAAEARGIYVGSRARPSLGPHEPTIYVSPSNLPPPPKYEFMAPPSYEEVVGTHYPNYQAQPITQPITAALAQPTQSTAVQANDTRPNDDDTRNNSETVVTVNERATVTSS